MPAVAFDAVLEEFQEEGTPNLSPTRIAERFSIQLQELAALAGVHRNTVRLHPESPKLQDYLRNLVRVLSAAATIQPDLERTIFFLKNAPIVAFEHKTAYQLVSEGRTDDVIRYFESIRSGYVG
ncbi:MAG: DNA-binding protein [Luteitalea sp.]|nr:DNA-binding protein [Luteitalea sp.]